MQIIFDLDGTLFHTESVSLPAVHSGIIDCGLTDVPDGIIKSLFGYSTPELCTRLFPEIGEEKQQFLSERVRYYERTLTPICGVLYDGIRDLLRKLKMEGFVLTLCTNSSEPYVANIMTAMKLEEFFIDIEWKKPGRSKNEALGELLRKWGRPAVMVGDKQVDIEAALWNKIPSIGVTWGYGEKDDLTNATILAEDVRKLASLLQHMATASEIYERGGANEA